MTSEAVAMAPVDSRRFGGPEDSVDYRVYMSQPHTALDPDKRRWGNQRIVVLRIRFFFGSGSYLAGLTDLDPDPTQQVVSN